MSADPKDTILHRHCLYYLERLKELKGANNFGDYTAHQLAEKQADAKFKLTPQERQKRDEWLDKKCPNRKREPPREDGPTLWDGLPTAR